MSNSTNVENYPMLTPITDSEADAIREIFATRLCPQCLVKDRKVIASFDADGYEHRKFASACDSCLGTP